MPAATCYDVDAVGRQELEAIPSVSPITEWAIQAMSAGELTGTRVAREDDHGKVAKRVVGPTA